MSSDTSLKMFVQLRSDNQMVKSCEFGLDPRYKFKEDSHSEIQTNFVTTATSANWSYSFTDIGKVAFQGIPPKKWV